MEDTVKIRAHHLLCLPGLGYSPGFVAEMGRVVAELCSDASLLIALVTDKKVKTMDRQVLRLLGLAAGNKLYASEALAKVKDRILISDYAVNVNSWN